MDKLRAIKLFVRLAELGSFTAVADQESSSKSMISKEISRLEADVGARLLHRSTRKLQLTAVGEGYLQHCREVLIKLADADTYVQGLQSEPRGKLKINAPLGLGVTDLGKLFAEFLRQFPQIELDIHLDDAAIDLIEHGFDLGFRVSSQLSDSSYIGKPLAHFRLAVCASAAYLNAHPAIKTAADLVNHNCFVYSYYANKNVWQLGQGVAVSGNLRVNNTLFILEAIKSGLGIGLAPDFICQDAISKGDVVEILQNETRPELTLYALYPSRRYLPPPLVQCIAFLQQWFNK